MTPEPSLESHKNSEAQPVSPDLLTKLDFPTGPIFGLDWSPDSRMLASAGYDQIKLWDTITQKESAILQGHSNIWGLAWSPGGSSLASASLDGSVKLWNSAGWQNTATLETGRAFCISWSPDGKRLAVGTAVFTDETNPETFSGKSQIWDLETLQLVRELSLPSLVISTAWSPDGRAIAIGQWDGKLAFWGGVSDKVLKSAAATNARSDVNGLAWSPDGRMLATAQQDGKVRIWNPETAEILRTLEGHTGWSRGLAWRPDGTMLASTGEDAAIRMWSIKNGQELACLTPGSLPIWSLKWSPDGNWLAAGTGIFGSEPVGGNVLIYKFNLPT